MFINIGPLVIAYFYILYLQGSDIETLGAEAAVEYEAELLDPGEDADLQDAQVSTSDGKNTWIITFTSINSDHDFIFFLFTSFSLCSLLSLTVCILLFNTFKYLFKKTDISFD